MANPVDSTSRSGWKAEMDPLAEASELEFLRWFYRNTDDQERNALEQRFMQEQQKAIPSIALI